MPNWVMNSVSVKGTKKQIKKFKETHFEGKEFNFETIIPMPKTIFRGDLSIEEVKKFGKENCWYDWSIKNWGTKWNACNCEIVDENDTELLFNFDTAWAFPEPVMKKLCAMYPSMIFDASALEESDAFDLEWINNKGKLKYVK